MKQTELVYLANEIFTLLDSNYPDKIEFLHYRSSFELLISVILSAQTTDRQVMEVAPVLFSKYPGPKELSEGNLDDIMEIIRSTGFYQVKAKNIKNTALMLVKDFNGEVPDTMEKLVLLPGVGRKSANVIMGGVFGKPAVIVDTHFARVVKRIGLTEQKEPEKIEKEIALIIENKKQYRFSMTVNLHGRRTCHARKPLCPSCFLSHLCKSAFK
ncbi:MAG: endonuclease III [Spirochaetia bacterium]|jgi:endonuclease-3|nr:endonuclease III [Spirochaetia bacterium]